MIVIISEQYQIKMIQVRWMSQDGLGGVNSDGLGTAVKWVRIWVKLPVEGIKFGNGFYVYGRTLLNT